MVQRRNVPVTGFPSDEIDATNLPAIKLRRRHFWAPYKNAVDDSFNIPQSTLPIYIYIVNAICNVNYLVDRERENNYV